jgi:hypothetical protein
MEVEAVESGVFSGISQVPAGSGESEGTPNHSAIIPSPDRSPSRALRMSFRRNSVKVSAYSLMASQYLLLDVVSVAADVMDEGCEEIPPGGEVEGIP